jgi:hypothetical protein
LCADVLGEAGTTLALEFVAEPRGGDVEYGLYIGVFPTTRRVAPPSGAHDDASSDTETR